MDPYEAKLHPDLRSRLAQIDGEGRIQVEIEPVQRRWRGLLRQLRGGAMSGVEYNVIGFTAICATLPKSLIAAVAARHDVVSIRLGRGGP